MDAVGSGHVPTLSCFTVALEHVYLKLHRSLSGVEFKKGGTNYQREHIISAYPAPNPLLLLSKEK